MVNNIIEVGKLDVTSSRFPIKFESPLKLEEAVDVIAQLYRKHYESRHDCTANIQRYGPSGDEQKAEIGYLSGESSRPTIALRVTAKERPDTSFSVDVLAGSLLPDSIDFHRNMWQDCHNKNWWKPEYRGN